MNKKMQEKREHKIQELRSRPYESLSDEEKLEIAFDKGHSHMSKYPRQGNPLSYDEFVMLCAVDDSMEFDYQGITYGVGNDVNKPRAKILFVDIDYIEVKHKKTKCTWKREEYYSSLDELLEQVRIDGKTIRDIWDEVET